MKTNMNKFKEGESVYVFIGDEETGMFYPGHILYFAKPSLYAVSIVYLTPFRTKRFMGIYGEDRIIHKSVCSVHMPFKSNHRGWYAG